ncbi:unnamed protein product [[Actinomadura] parvosata subsp. kistnae]|nr:unnamed protein product [Actinomadura parvosata subsp. kistnae]
MLLNRIRLPRPGGIGRARTRLDSRIRYRATTRIAGIMIWSRARPDRPHPA